MMTDPNKETSHHPFWIREAIVWSAIAFGGIGGYLCDSFALGLALYFCGVTVFDGISHYAFHLKPSDFVNPERLRESEKVTPEEFDRYFDTRRCIRFASLCMASMGFGGAFFLSLPALKVFCMAYVVSTIWGILFVRFYIKIPHPRLIRRDDRYLLLFPPKCGLGADFVVLMRPRGPMNS